MFSQVILRITYLTMILLFNTPDSMCLLYINDGKSET